MLDIHVRKGHSVLELSILVLIHFPKLFVFSQSSRLDTTTEIETLSPAGDTMVEVSLNEQYNVDDYDPFS